MSSSSITPPIPRPVWTPADALDTWADAEVERLITQSPRLDELVRQEMER